MGDKIRVMYSEEEVDKRIRELGEQISKRYEGKTVHMICVLKLSLIHIWMGTCLYQEGYKPLLINCEAVIWL